MNRRDFLAAGASTMVATAFAADPPAQPSRLGLLFYSYGRRAAAEKNTGFARPASFIEFAHARGANGVQMPLGTWNEADARTIRQTAGKRGVHLEGIVSPPKDDAEDLERFRSELRMVRDCGGNVVRVVASGGRRYEVFDKPADFPAFVERATASFKRAEPLAREQKVTLAIENHKDFRSDEQIDLLKKLGSEWLGVCLDLGNNLSLLEDPVKVIERLAPLTKTVHVKDIGIEQAPEGFRMAEVPLGQGIFDLKKMIGIIRKAAPQARLNLEMMTRDPLLIPCLTDKYWATLDQVPARELARTLAFAGTRARKEPLIIVTKQPADEQLALEEANVRESLRYAREAGW